MKPLERRAWFSLLSLGFSAFITYGLWVAASLPINLSGGVVFLFATVGVGQGASPLLALALIKINPRLGQVT